VVPPYAPYAHAQSRKPVTILAAEEVGTRYIPARDFDDNADRDHRRGGAEASDDTDRGGQDPGDRRRCFHDHPGLRPALRERGRAGGDLRVAWTIPFWLILFSFLIPGLTSLGQGAPLDGVPPEGIPPGDVPLDEDPATPAASPFAGLIQSARFYLIFLLLVWVGAMVHAWFAARKFNRKNGIELR
jgi:hypothetical protein